MNTCSFSYITLRTNLPCRATGVERTWEYLKAEFNREGDGLPYPEARYYETIGSGPQLFATSGNDVYYHDQQKWHQYKSAYDIEFSKMELPE